MKKKSIAVCLLLSLSVTIMTQAQETIHLYEGKIPNNQPCDSKEKTFYDHNIKIVEKVTVPTLKVYLPAQQDSFKTAILICPGGGYQILASGHEGDDVAFLLNKHGIAAFVLQYRLPDDACMLNKEIVPLQDAQRAIELIRKNASKWNINANKLGIMGFSAGGHLAATASTHFLTAYTENKDNTNLRPDFSILIYPVISFTDALTHQGSRENLLKTPYAMQDEKKIYYSNELQVNEKTPPAFLVHATDDETVKVENSFVYYQALKKNNVPVEMHIYSKGGHGFGLNNPTTKEKWMSSAINWLQANQFIKGNVM
jgi:acetyl esterase/lipase